MNRRTASGIEIKPVYGAADVPDTVEDEVPGRFPYTRGIHPEMYRKRLWTMRQYAGFGDAEASNERYRSLIEAGQDGISAAFDLPTQLGYDSDDPRATAEVGRVGVAIDTLGDVEELFAGIPLDAANPSFNINAPAPVLVAMYAALCRRSSVDLARVRGTFQNDILKEFISRGAYIFPPEASIRLAVDVVEFCHREMPLVYPMSVSGGHIRNAGATATQAIATTFADAVVYLDEAVRRGLDATGIASRLSFLFHSRQDFFVEAATFRAARRLWAHLMRDRYSIDDPRGQHLRFFAGTANMMFTRQEPLNNIARATLGCLGVVLGGAQASTVIGYDEAYDIPTEEAQTIGLRTQQIIAYETNIPATVDPLGGSYYVEALTDELERQMRDFLDEIEADGGVIGAIESGWLQQRFYDQAYEYEKGIQTGDVPVVSVNLFRGEDKGDKEPGEDELFGMVGPLHDVDESIAARQAERLAKHRAVRDRARVDSTLSAVGQAALAGRNVVYPIEDAVVAGATIGEVCDVLRGALGTYNEGGQF